MVNKKLTKKNKNMTQKISMKLEETKIYDEDFKVKGEMENYNLIGTSDKNINMKVLIKVQSCVRRFLQTSKFLKENRNNKSVIFKFKNRLFFALFYLNLGFF